MKRDSLAGADMMRCANRTIWNIYREVDWKAIVAVLAVELGVFGFAAYKGAGSLFLTGTLLMMSFSVVTCVITYYYGTDIYILCIMLILTDLGFAIQVIQTGEPVELGKCLLDLLASQVVFFVFLRFGRCFSKDIWIVIMMAGQYLISAVTFVLGSGEDASISLRGITPFEIVKVIYIFVASGLLCSDRDGFLHLKVIRLRNKEFSLTRRGILTLHTLGLSLFLLKCSELGTLLIIAVLYLLMCAVFEREGKKSLKGIAAFLGAFCLFWAVCALFLYPEIGTLEKFLPSTAVKLIRRFGVARYPERYYLEDGYQGTMGLMAIVLGGALGIETERYRLSNSTMPLPEAANDFAFANVLQTCGLMMGILIIVFHIALLKRGFDIAGKCRSTYLQGISVGITILLTAEALVHIGYNIAILPITGIPMYFCSQGFTAILTGIACIGVLLAVSTGRIDEP